MHHLDAIKLAELGANITISKDSGVHHLDAMKIIKAVVNNGGVITIEKDYHHLDIQKMVKVAGNKITIAV